MQKIAMRIRQNLENGLAPEFLKVEDVSENHRGHAGYRDGGESHFDVTIKAPCLAGKSRVAQHRAVHAAIGGEIMGTIHALAIKIV